MTPLLLVDFQVYLIYCFLANKESINDFKFSYLYTIPVKKPLHFNIHYELSVLVLLKKSLKFFKAHLQTNRFVYKLYF